MGRRVGGNATGGTCVGLLITDLVVVHGGGGGGGGGRGMNWQK